MSVVLGIFFLCETKTHIFHWLRDGDEVLTHIPGIKTHITDLIKLATIFSVDQGADTLWWKYK